MLALVLASLVIVSVCLSVWCSLLVPLSLANAAWSWCGSCPCVCWCRCRVVCSVVWGILRATTVNPRFFNPDASLKKTSQQSLHITLILRLLLGVTVKGLLQCDLTQFLGGLVPQQQGDPAICAVWCLVVCVCGVVRCVVCVCVLRLAAPCLPKALCSFVCRKLLRATSVCLKLSAKW